MPKHTEKERAKKPPENPIIRALRRFSRGMFGMGVEGTSRALENAQNIFSRTAKKIEKDTKTIKKRKR